MFEDWFFCCGDELYLVAVSSVANFVLLQTIRRDHHPRTVLAFRDPGKLGLVLKLTVWHFLCLFVFLFVVELWQND